MRDFSVRFFRCERLASRLVIRKQKNRSQDRPWRRRRKPGNSRRPFWDRPGAAPFVTGPSIHGGTNTPGFRLSPNRNRSNAAAVGPRRRRGAGHPFRRHPANHQTRPERTERGQGAGAGARRRDDRLGRRQPGLRSAPARRTAIQTPDRRGGGEAGARQRLAADQHRHHHGRGGEGARPAIPGCWSSPTIFTWPTSSIATSRCR